MCTVTFIPTEKGVVFTSSRDERSDRSTIPPHFYSLYDQQILFPRDEKAGGTWIAASHNFRFACLLNGAFEKHPTQERYRKSRGLVLLESFQYDTIDSFSALYNPEGIEPFTLLLIDFQPTIHLEELRWDGQTLFRKSIDTTQKHIWSSSTLYAPEIREERQQIFRQWIEDHPDDEDHDILQFHSSRHGLALEYDLLMERTNSLRTVSVTQIRIEKEAFQLFYNDLIGQKTVEYLVKRGENVL